MRRKNLARVASVGVVVMGGLMFSAIPASADYAHCNPGLACMWTGENYAGKPQVFFEFSIGSVGSYKINSIANNGTSSVARFYDKTGYQGDYISLNNPARGGQVRDPKLSNGINGNAANWANRIKSAQFI
jgi:hypothetical protein